MNGGHNKGTQASGLIEKPWAFLAVFLCVFFLMSVALFALDFYPESKNDSEEEVREVAPTLEIAEEQTVVFPIESPTRIVIDSVGINTSIENPASTDLQVLDDALFKGAVRYPGSALLGEDQRMFIFGHQSGLPVVKNQAFKAFNGLQDLSVGEEILVYSDSAVYRYQVQSVEHVSAVDAWVELGGNDRMLILTTCDSFGKKQDRYVVKAAFVSREGIN